MKRRHYTTDFKKYAAHQIIIIMLYPLSSFCKICKNIADELQGCACLDS